MGKLTALVLGLVALAVFVVGVVIMLGWSVRIAEYTWKCIQKRKR